MINVKISGHELNASKSLKYLGTMNWKSIMILHIGFLQVGTNGGASPILSDHKTPLVLKGNFYRTAIGLAFYGEGCGWLIMNINKQ